MPKPTGLRLPDPDVLDQPELTVAAIVEHENRFLVVEEEVHGRRVINQPAGHVEPGESLLAAVCREMIEETAWHFEPTAVVGVYLWRRAPDANPFLRVAFTGRCHSHDPARPLDTGILQAIWLSRGELLDRADTLRSPMVLQGIDDYLAGRRAALESVRGLHIPDLLPRALRLN